MAKIVIAGKSNCPYYAKVELLADTLANSVDSFRVHKIVKSSDEWEKWLNDECNQRKFKHAKSPIIWRELVDRGGKGILIGGADEFQEYAWGYYGIKSPQMTSDLTKIADENVATKKEVDKELEEFKKLSKPMKIAITHALSPVTYHLLNTISSGEVFGKDIELQINLICNKDDESIKGVKMEIEDLAHTLVRGINNTTDQAVGLKDCEAVIVLDQLTRDEEESEESWLKRNCEMLSSRIKAIDFCCKPSVKVLIASQGPMNTSLSAALKDIKNIDKKNIVTMPSLLENQAKALLARKVKVNTSDVVDVVVWGDNEKYYCDISQAKVHNHDGPIWGPPSYSRLATLLVHEEQWFNKDFTEALANRYTLEAEKMKHSPCFAHAAAINTLMKQWWFGMSEDQLVTLGIPSEGWYDVPEGMVFNFPARLLPAGRYDVVQDIELSDESKSKLKECVDYLLEHTYVLNPELRPPPPPEPEKPASPLAADSPHPPTMTPIKEETDQDLKRSDDTAAEGTETASESEAPRPGATSADPDASQPLEQIQEDVEPPSDVAAEPEAAAAAEDSAADPSAAAEATADTATEEV